MMKKSTTTTHQRYYVAGLISKYTRDFSDKSQAEAFFDSIDPRSTEYDLTGNLIRSAGYATLWDTSVVPWDLIKRNF
jgi:hypothetical protein